MESPSADRDSFSLLIPASLAKYAEARRDENMGDAADRVRGRCLCRLSTQAQLHHGLNDAITNLALKLVTPLKFGLPLSQPEDGDGKTSRLHRIADAVLDVGDSIPLRKCQARLSGREQFVLR